MRKLTPVLGVFFGVPIVIGSLLAHAHWIAVPAMVALGGAAAAVARKVQAGQLALFLGLPMVGVGVSYTDVAEGAALAALILVGSLHGWLASLAWPQQAPADRNTVHPNPASPTRPYALLAG